VVGALFQGSTAGGDLFTAGVILAIMILPIVTAVSREVIAVVPGDLREAAMALGATRYETVRMAVLPYARSGIVGATMLGLGLALLRLLFLVAYVVGKGYPARSANFFSKAPTVPGLPGGGIGPSFVGTGLIVGMAVLFSVPVGVLAALYLSEYGHGRLASTVR